jgi:hypothetical protein
MDQFSLLSVPSSTRAFGASPDGTALADLFRYVRGDATPPHPVRVPWGEGRRTPSDVLWIGVVELVVSPRFLDALTGCSGWSTFPVELIDGHGNDVPGYAGLAVSGRCDRVVHDLARVKTDGRWPEYVGLLFDPDRWDGSDIFYPRRGSGPIVTKRLADRLRRAKVTNIIITPLPEVTRDKGMVDRMRQQRAGPYAED